MESRICPDRMTVLLRTRTYRTLIGLINRLYSRYRLSSKKLYRHRRATKYVARPAVHVTANQNTKNTPPNKTTTCERTHFPSIHPPPAATESCFQTGRFWSTIHRGGRRRIKRHSQNRSANVASRTLLRGRSLRVSGSAPRSDMVNRYGLKRLGGGSLKSLAGGGRRMCSSMGVRRGVCV